MTRSVVVLDTGMLLVHLQVPGYTKCGPDNDTWDVTRIETHLKRRQHEGALFVLPLAVIIETARLIVQCGGDRFKLASDLIARATDCIEGKSPWVAFSQQSDLWESNSLRETLVAWPQKAAQKLSLADYTISRVAEFYAQLGHPVEILTGDAGLKALEPIAKQTLRRSRQPR